MRKIVLTAILMVIILLNTWVPAADADGGLNYKVKPGDTLYGIGKKFGISHSSIMKNNNLVSFVIVPGQTLNIQTENFEVHTVRYGDTIYGLSRKYGTSVLNIKAASGLSSVRINPGMKLLIPDEKYKSMDNNRDNQTKPVIGRNFSFSKDDLYLLAKLIHAEARGESVRGQVAVGAVIMNRLTSRSFPASIREIIFQKTNGVYQFTPVQDGQIKLEPDRTSFFAAQKALAGEDPTNGALFFYNPETSSDRWIKTLAVKKVIGNHAFAR